MYTYIKMRGRGDVFTITPLFEHNITLKALLNDKVAGLTELDKTKKYCFTLCCFNSDKSFDCKDSLCQ